MHRSPSRVCGDLSLRLLALELCVGDSETYHVAFRAKLGAAFRPGVLRHVAGESWDLLASDSKTWNNVPFGSPDEMFDAALGANNAVQSAFATEVSAAVPHWPSSIAARLARRRLSGSGTVAFDAAWFLSQLATSAFDRPMLLVDAASKLGLDGLLRASAIVRQSARGTLTTTLLQALSSKQTSDSAVDWGGEGRLIGEFGSGELAQLGTDVVDGCRTSIGTGLRHVVFDPAQPLGLSLGPLQPADVPPEQPHDACAGEPPLGMGVDVGEVEPGGAADRAGVTEGMVVLHLSEPELVVSRGGRSSVPFETVLNEIDTRRAAGHALHVTFDSAAPVTNLYAVEMPADLALTALAAASEGGDSQRAPIEVGVGQALAAMCEGAVLWREDTPRLFLGEAGSLTCAHTDICPQIEIAHALVGVKILGVASHASTPRLNAEHAGDEAGDPEDESKQATRVPTNRPLTEQQSRLLRDADITLTLLQEGDLAVFDSGALHFASNGANGPSAALYHGVITPAAVPRLRIAAAKTADPQATSDGAYRNHLFAADLLRVVEPRLAQATKKKAKPPSPR